VNKKISAQIGLLIVTIIWGITFVMVQEALDDALPFSLLTLRFGLATILTILIINKNVFIFSKHEIFAGFFCGVILFFGYAFQTFGLWKNEFFNHSSPTNSAFITSISVLFVPIILVILKIQKIRLRIWFAVIMATIGLYFLLLPGGGINVGDFITFGCSISFALHIILQDYYIKNKIQLMPLFCIQMATVTFISIVLSFYFESQPIEWTTQLINAILITGIFATFLGFLIMIWAQRILNPTETAIIFTTEPVAAAIFSMLFAGEILGLWGWFGAFIICIAVIYGETG